MMHGQTDRQIERKTDRKTERQTDRREDRQKGRQTDRQTDGRTDGQTDRHQTGKQTDKDKALAKPAQHVFVMQANFGMLFPVQAGKMSATAARRKGGGKGVSFHVKTNLLPVDVI